METGEAESCVFAIGNSDDRMDVAADVEKLVAGVLGFVHDTDAVESELVHLIDLGWQAADFLVVVAFDEDEGNSDFPDEIEKGSDDLLGLAGVGMEKITGDDESAGFACVYEGGNTFEIASGIALRDRQSVGTERRRFTQVEIGSNKDGLAPFDEESLIRKEPDRVFFDQHDRVGIGSVFADVFIPESGVFPDEVSHHFDTGGIVDHGQFHAVTFEQAFRAGEIAILTDDYFGNTVEQGRARTHGAGGQRGVEGAFPINRRGESSRVFQCVHLGMEHGAVFLNAAVVTTPEDFPVVDQDAANGDASLIQSVQSLTNRGLQKVIHG